LTTGFAVATAGVAAGFCKDRNDLVGEIDRGALFEIGDGRF